MAKTTAVESTKRTFIYNVVEAERVVDGDTCILLLDLGFNIFYKVDVRLMGLDTPEKSTPEGKVVKAKVEEWMTGKTLILVSKELDKYGRVLGEIKTVDGESLNKWLIDKGYARAYNGEKKVAWTEAQIKRIMENAK
jgi:endonuclease YncB( thermonuclease family)